MKYVNLLTVTLLLLPFAFAGKRKDLVFLHIFYYTIVISFTALFIPYLENHKTLKDFDADLRILRYLCHQQILLTKLS